MDFRADETIRKVIADLCDNNHRLDIYEWAAWKHDTEQLLKQYSIIEVINFVLIIVEKLSDKQWIESYPVEIFCEAPRIKTEGTYREIINSKLNVIDVAKSYGIKVKKNKAICPFHNDTDPSLTFYPETNSFFCHGCRKGGDIIEFIRRIENGPKRSN